MGSSIRDLKWLKWCNDGAKIWSTCAKAQYMVLLVSKEGYLVGSGYNGGPPGEPHCKDGGCPRALKSPEHKSSNYDDCISLHSEHNAFLHSDFNAYRGGTMYVNGVPCYGCVKLIANSGLAKLVYLFDGERPQWEASIDLLDRMNIDMFEYTEENLNV